MTGFYENYDDAEGVHKGSAEQSALEAAASATAAASSATSSETSATSSSTKAGEAATSASTATTKAAEAATSATTATTKASESATSAAASDTSATESATSATASESSRQASASAAAVAVSAYGSAFNSATASAASATAAAGSESAVAASATAAAGSATTASTSASNAATSETNAATSATAAAASATLANSAEVVTVAGIAADVTAVAGIDDNVTSVAGIASDVTTVAAEPLKTNIATVAATPLSTNINIVGPAASSVTTVAGDIAKVNTVAADLSGSDTIGTVAGVASNVTTVSGIAADVTTVAGITAGDISLVAAIDDKVTQVAAINNEVAVVGSDPYKTKVETVAESVYKGKVETVSGLTSEVTSVANIASDVTTVSANITDIQNAEQNANTASNAASNASTSETNAASSASAAATSADAAAASAGEITDLTAATGAAGSSASYDSNTGVLTIPRGDTGIQGIQGVQGAAGPAGTGSAAGSLVYSGVTKLQTTPAGVSVIGGVDVNGPAGSSASLGEVFQLGQVDSAGGFITSVDWSTNVYKPIQYRASSHSFLSGTSQKLNVNSTGIDVTGEITADGLALGDNDKATFGAGDDLQIYHSGTHSFITDSGTGSLFIGGDTETAITNAAGTEYKLRTFSDGSVSLYHNNAAKLATTSTGIDVTGTATMDGLTVDGDSTVQSTSGNTSTFLLGQSGVRNWRFQNIATTGELQVKPSPTKTAFEIDTNGDISFYEDTGTTPKMVWDASAESLKLSGNGLDISAGTGDSQIRVVTGSGDAGIELNAGSSQPWYIYNEVNDFHIRSDDTDYLTIDTSGKVGIGTSSPSAKLDSQETYDTVTNILTNGTYAAKFGGDTGVGAAGRAQGIMISARNGTARGAAILAENQNSGNAHDLLFATSSNASVPAERMRITSSGNVGIGTSAPSEALEVAGNIQLSAGADRGIIGPDFRSLNIFANPNSSTEGIKFSTDGGTTTEVFIQDGGNVGIGTSSPSEALHVKDLSEFLVDVAASDSAVEFKSNLGNSWRIGNDSSLNAFAITQAASLSTNVRFFIANGGNVGIGTSLPATALHVNSGTENVVARFESTDTATAIEFKDSTGTVTLETRNDFRFKSGTTINAIIDSSGNVGIGTSSPASGLHLVNAGLSNQLRISNTTADSTTKYGGVLGSHYSNSEEPITGMLLTSTSSVTGGAVSIGGGISDANAVNNIKFYTAANNTTIVGTERMRIDSSGRVGIGTSSPTAKLDVNGEGCFKKTYSYAQDNYHIKLKSAYGSGVSSYISNIASGDRMNISAGGYYYGASLYQLADGATGMGAINIGEDGALTYQSTTGETANSLVNPTERMRIDSSGNVGIGTDSPASTLEIAKNDQTNGATLSITNSFDGGSWAAGDTVGTVDFRVDDGSTTQKVRGQIKVFDDAASGNNSYPYANAMSFSTGYFNTLNERMRINSSGRVGIGASSIDGNSNLQIQDDSGNALLRLRSSTSGLSGVDFGDSGDIDIGGIRYSNSSNHMQFNVNAEERMRIDSSGNLLVGKTSGNVALAGTIINRTGDAYFTRDGSYPLYLNRLTSDGDIISLRKDGANVGSIGVALSDNLYFSGVDAGLGCGTGAIYPASTTGQASDNDTDLGTSSTRFKDLYLSGGVYLGGTGAANKLDDYEEGSWTPTYLFDVGGGSINYLTQTATYTKVGRLVTVSFLIRADGLSVSDYFVRLGGIPFSCKGAGQTIGRVGIQNPLRDTFNISVEGGTSSLLFYATNAHADYAKGDDVNGQFVSGSFTYMTA